MVRGGRRIGESRFFPENAAGNSEDETVTAFLLQHYRKITPPKKIFLREKPSAKELSAELTIVVARGEAKRRVAFAAENARHALTIKSTQKALRNARLLALAKRLQLSIPPKRMECFDISHSNGEETVAARVVFVDGLAIRPNIVNTKLSPMAAVTPPPSVKPCAVVIVVPLPKKHHCRICFWLTAVSDKCVPHETLCVP